MPNKPGKYGILMRTLSDAQYRYMCNLEVYRGDDPSVALEKRGPTATVMSLTEPYHKEEALRLIVTTHRWNWQQSFIMWD